MMSRSTTILLLSSFLLASFFGQSQSLPTLEESTSDVSGERIPGYPGVLSRDYIQLVVKDEVRARMTNWAVTTSSKAEEEKGGNTTSTSLLVGGANKDPNKRRIKRRDIEIQVLEETEGGTTKQQETTKQQQDNEDDINPENDLTGLNDILKTFSFDIPETVIEQPFLGEILSIAVSGSCGNITVQQIDLDYSYDNVSLTYNIDVFNLNVSCMLMIDWDTGDYDVEDELEVYLPVVDSDFSIDVKLNGKPPETSNFGGCNAEIQLGNISSHGGFSSNIVNDLDYFWQDIVDSETVFITELLCETLTGFTSIVDGLLMSATDLVEPFLNATDIPVDPLEPEKNLMVDEELVDFTNSTLGTVLESVFTNLQGVVGAYQINTLIELNLLDENGLFTFNLSTIEGNESSSPLRQVEGKPKEDPPMTMLEECSLLRRRNLLQNINHNIQRRFLQEAETSEEAESTSNSTTNSTFTINDFAINSIQVGGLNTFSDNNFQPLDIIGQYTLQSKLEVGNVTLRVNLAIDIEFNGVNIQEEALEVFLPLNGISLSISVLLGLSKAVVDSFSLGTFLNADDIIGCLTSSLVTVQFSELGVVIGGVGVPLISGLISPGVENLIGTAIEAFVLAYQDLVVQAIPNVAQYNVTEIVNDFVDCFIRTEFAGNSCPTEEDMEEEADPLDIPGFFSFSSS